MKRILFLMMLGLSVSISAQDKETDVSQSVERGALIYEDFCVNCHMASGEGVAAVFPPLAKSDFLLKNRTESIKAVKFGMTGEITVNGEKYNSAMVSPGLDDEEIADVMNYILSNWENQLKNPVTPEEVSKINK